MRLSISLLAILLPISATAQQWTGNTSDDWFDGNNWTSGSAPTTSATVIIDKNTPNNTEMNNGSSIINTVNIGSTATANGKLTITNNANLTLTTNSSAYVGENGTGSLTISDGGQVNFTDPTPFSWLVVGSEAGSQGNLTVTGKDSSLNMNGTLIIGDLGNGTALIERGATVNAGYQIQVGDGGIGVLTIDGKGTTVTTGSLVAGGGDGSTVNGHGTINISNEAHLISGQNTFSDATGTQTDIIMTDKAKWTVNNYWYLGWDGNATLDMSGGSILDTSSSSQNSMIGVYSDNAWAKLSGVGTEWISQGGIFVGFSGTGTLTVAEGAKVTEQTSLSLGYNADGNGTLNIGAPVGSTSIAPGEVSAPILAFGNGKGLLNFNHNSSNYLFDTPIKSNNVTDDSQIAHNGTGTTILTGDSSLFKGLTTINQGTLQVDNNLGGNFNINADGTLAGIGTVSSTGMTLTNSGNIAPGDSITNSFGTLTVAGNYVGNNGRLTLHTKLEGDTSNTDKLIIQGDSSGSTRVKVINAGGIGQQTNNGIKVIEVQGNSSGNFTQDGRIAAGAYDYKLQRGNSAGTDLNNWYLTSYLTSGGTGFVKPTIRPEAGTYLAQIEQNREAFSHSFHDRQQQLNNAYQSSWIRVIYNHTESRAGLDSQINNKTHSTTIHFGSDIYQKDQLHLGLMAGYTHGDIDSKSRITGFDTDGKSDGYSLGAYATWYDQTPEEGGLYIDSWVQYNWFDNKVNNQWFGNENYKTRGFSTSLETGYSFVLNKTNNSTYRWTLEPQIQIIYNNLDSGNLTDATLTKVHIGNNDNLASRIGLRFQGHNDKGFEPFVTFNYWNNNNPANIHMGYTKISSHKARNTFESKAGGQVPIAKNLYLYGQLQGVWGKDNTKGYGGDLGLKLLW